MPLGFHGHHCWSELKIYTNTTVVLGPFCTGAIKQGYQIQIKDAIDDESHGIDLLGHTVL